MRPVYYYNGYCSQCSRLLMQLSEDTVEDYGMRFGTPPYRCDSCRRDVEIRLLKFQWGKDPSPTPYPLPYKETTDDEGR